MADDGRERATQIAPDIFLWSGYFDRAAQEILRDEIFAGLSISPFYQPVMPRSGKAFSVLQSNFGPLGWVSDRAGYRYERLHPVTRQAFAPLPQRLQTVWRDLSAYPAAVECCLINYYRAGAKMGLHQDRDEAALDAPVISVSLGDTALFRFGRGEPIRRGGATSSIRLQSGDVLLFGGTARLIFHGIDKMLAGSSGLLPEGGRLNLTLRRVTPASGNASIGP